MASQLEEQAFQTFALVPEIYQQAFKDAGADFPDELVSEIKKNPQAAVELLNSNKQLKQAVLTVFQANSDAIMQAAQQAAQQIGTQSSTMFRRGGKLDYGLQMFKCGGKTKKKCNGGKVKRCGGKIGKHQWGGPLQIIEPVNKPERSWEWNYWRWTPNTMKLIPNTPFYAIETYKNNIENPKEPVIPEGMTIEQYYRVPEPEPIGYTPTTKTKVKKNQYGGDLNSFKTNPSKIGNALLRNSAENSGEIMGNIKPADITSPKRTWRSPNSQSQNRLREFIGGTNNILPNPYIAPANKPILDDLVDRRLSEQPNRIYLEKGPYYFNNTNPKIKYQPL